MTEKTFLEKYPEFDNETMLEVLSYLEDGGLETVEEILDKHFVRKEDAEKAIQAAKLVTVEEGIKIAINEKVTKVWIEKQKVRDVLNSETFTKHPIPAVRYAFSIVKKELGL